MNAGRNRDLFPAPEIVATIRMLGSSLRFSFL
jgi:hypothetical protein